MLLASTQVQLNWMLKIWNPVSILFTATMNGEDHPLGNLWKQNSDFPWNNIVISTEAKRMEKSIFPNGVQQISRYVIPSGHELPRVLGVGSLEMTFRLFDSRKGVQLSAYTFSEVSCGRLPRFCLISSSLLLWNFLLDQGHRKEWRQILRHFLLGEKYFFDLCHVLILHKKLFKMFLPADNDFLYSSFPLLIN